MANVIIDYQAMNLFDNPDLKHIRSSLIAGMLEYMSDGDVSYREQDVDSCGKLLDGRLTAIAAAANPDAAAQGVKSTVTKLNVLNEHAGEDLIETDQREQNYEFVMTAGALPGFNGEDDDVTEQWRECDDSRL